MALKNQVFWQLNSEPQPPLRKNISADIVVIGGGMAGLTVAQSFIEAGKEVVLLEKFFCGAGASGKSSGFITPNSELSLSDLVDRFGPNKAKNIWQFANSGVEHIRETIKKYDLNCDYVEQDTLVVASSPSDFKDELLKEYKWREKLHYPTILYHTRELTQVIHAKDYFGGISYPGSFSINGFLYCSELKNKLIEKNLRVYEDTAVHAIRNTHVRTEHGSVTAQHIIVCVDAAAPELIHNEEIYHVQTFLLLSEPLEHSQIAQLLPNKQYMMWDTELIYNYFRLTGDKRLLFGGATLLYTYAQQEKYGSQLVAHKVQRYIKKHFPQLKLRLEYMWPGMLGVSKDLLPIAGYDEKNPHVYYITACTGLPWAAALARQTPQIIIEKEFPLEHIFSPQRSFFIGKTLQKLVGKRVAFALSHLKTVSSW